MGRAETIKRLLDPILRCYVRTSEEEGTKADGSISAVNGAYCMVMEVKNKIATGGSDPSIQGATSYAKYWGQVGAYFIYSRELCLYSSQI